MYRTSDRSSPATDGGDRVRSIAEVTTGAGASGIRAF
jgi:hypothetical protein